MKVKRSITRSERTDNFFTALVAAVGLLAPGDDHAIVLKAILYVLFDRIDDSSMWAKVPRSKIYADLVSDVDRCRKLCDAYEEVLDVVE